MTVKRKILVLSIITFLTCATAHAMSPKTTQQRQETVQNLDPQRVAAIASYLASGGLRHLTNAEVSPEELKAAQSLVTTSPIMQKIVKPVLCFTRCEITNTPAPTTSVLAEALKAQPAYQTPVANQQRMSDCQSKSTPAKQSQARPVSKVPEANTFRYPAPPVYRPAPPGYYGSPY